MALIDFTSKGLYCSAGNFYIDPWQTVDKAIITHAHSDHAQWGSDRYFCHTASLPLLKLRLGDVAIDTIQWNDPIHINRVKVSLHPAGHIIGSSQVRIEYNNEYNIENNMPGYVRSNNLLCLYPFVEINSRRSYNEAFCSNCVFKTGFFNSFF